MDRLKELRAAAGLTQQDVAKFLGVERSTYVKYERGNSDPPTPTLIRLADYFGVSVDYIIGHNPSQASVMLPKISKDDISLLEKFHSLDCMAQARILNSLEFEYKSIPQENVKSSGSTA